MLESITPHGSGHVDDDGEEGETAAERREREEQEAMDREDLARPQFVLEEEVTPVVHTGAMEDSSASEFSHPSGNPRNP
jgi:hypothetical protein